MIFTKNSTNRKWNSLPESRLKYRSTLFSNKSPFTLPLSYGRQKYNFAITCLRLNTIQCIKANSIRNIGGPVHPKKYFPTNVDGLLDIFSLLFPLPNRIQNGRGRPGRTDCGARVLPLPRYGKANLAHLQPATTHPITFAGHGKYQLDPNAQDSTLKTHRPVKLVRPKQLLVHV